MVRIHLRIALAYQVTVPGADFIFNIEAAHTAQQTVVWEQLQVFPLLQTQHSSEGMPANRLLRLTAPPGPLHVNYQASVDVSHHLAAPDTVPEVPVAWLPTAVLPYLYPSRYCPSDALGNLVMDLFGALPQGYRRVLAVQDWVQRQVTFKSNTSHSGTSALDTLRDRVGVCRDFAHLMITLCRALNIPARFCTGIDYGADPALGPTDFHAYVEVYLGHRWYLFDPSGTAIPMGFIRIGTGRDAADVSFATIFGKVSSSVPVIQTHAEVGGSMGFAQPVRCDWAISTA